RTSVATPYPPICSAGQQSVFWVHLASTRVGGVPIAGTRAPRRRAAASTCPATRGSDPVEGTEQLTSEVAQRDSRQLVSREPLRRGDLDAVRPGLTGHDRRPVHGRH